MFTSIAEKRFGISSSIWLGSKLKSDTFKLDRMLRIGSVAVLYSYLKKIIIIKNKH